MSVSRYVRTYVRTSACPSVHKKFFRFQWNLVRRQRSMTDARWYAVWPDPRSRSKSRGFWSSENCTFQGYLLHHLQWELANDHRLRKYTVSQKRVPPLLLIDLHNSFTAAKSSKFPTKFILSYPPHLKYVAALPWKTLKSEICTLHARKTSQV